MRKTIPIKNIKEAKPIKGVWYDYYGDIFVSVIPLEKKKHIRRKAVIPDDKEDNSASPWHRQWQYEIIEAIYGIPVSGKKTYEIIIEVEGERHIIDSVVADKIAIEFQHTLSVSLEEMDSRIAAHNKAGFLPYLVLDFSDCTYNEFQSNVRDKKIKKWLQSEYYKSDNLFLDLQDYVIRLSAGVIREHILYDKETFINNLLKLEEDLESSKKALKEKLIKEKRERKIKLANEAKKKIRKKRIKIARKETHLKKLKERNREEKFQSEDYEYFRKCYRDKVIRPYIIDYAKDLFISNSDCWALGLYYKELDSDYELTLDDEYISWDEKEYIYASQERFFYIRYVISRNRNIPKIAPSTYVEVLIGKGKKRKKYVFEFENGKTVMKK